MEKVGIFKGSLPPEKAKILEQIKQEMDAFKEGTLDFSKAKSEEWRGHRFLPMFSPEIAKRFYEGDGLGENTVIIASFPKTGTNWILEITRQILFGNDEKLNALSKSLPLIFQAIEMWKPEKLDLMEHIALPRTLYFTHLPQELMNFDKIKQRNGKIVVPVRNPKDQAVSWYHFSKNNPNFDGIRDEMGEDWNNFFSKYVQGKHPIITKPGEWYPEYLLGWYEKRDEDNLMFLHYEDLKKDPVKEIKKLATFLGVNVSDDRVAEIAKATSFAAMKKQQDDEVDDNAAVRKNITMMRKGQVGSWKETFTVAQSELMDKIVEKKLGHTDIKFTYEL